MADQEARLRFRPDIEGLRAIAVAAVVAFHIDFRGATGGFAGVDVFFVLSGYLITSLLVRDVAGSARAGLAEFYARRARRLLPAATATIVGSLAIALVFASPLEQLEVGIEGRAATLFHANARFAAERTAYHGEADPPPVFLQFWTLSLEEQFYAVWPILLIVAAALARRRGRSVAGGALAVLAVVVPLSFLLGVDGARSTPVHAFFLLQYRAWELGIGAILALAPRLSRVPARVAQPLRVVGLAAIAWAVVSYGDATAWPGVAALVPVLGTAAVVAAGGSSVTGPAYALLASRPMQVVGRLSYSIYLWHWPLTWAFDDLDDVNVVIYGVIVLALAAATYAVIEQPVRRSGWLAARRTRTFGLAALLLAVAVGATLVFEAARTDVDELHAGRRAAGAHVVGRAPSATDFVPSNLEPALAPGMSADDAFAAGDLECSDIGDCDFGDRSADAVAVLFGDSHAAHWIPALGGVADDLGWRAHAIVVSGCTPFASIEGDPNPARCHDAVDRAWEAVEDLQPDVLILSGRHVELRRRDPEGWRAGVAAGVGRAPRGSATVVLSETPTAPRLVPYCLSEHLDDVRPCEPALSREVEDVNAALAEATQDLGSAGVADLTPLLCHRDRCPVIVDNILVYRDANHVTTAFAASRARDFARAVREALQ